MLCCEKKPGTLCAASRCCRRHHSAATVTLRINRAVCNPLTTYSPNLAQSPPQIARWLHQCCKCQQASDPAPSKQIFLSTPGGRTYHRSTRARNDLQRRIRCGMRFATPDWSNRRGTLQRTSMRCNEQQPWTRPSRPPAERHRRRFSRTSQRSPDCARRRTHQRSHQLAEERWLAATPLMEG